ncbi:WG repeat-containing protein [Paenibacillus rhizoplanae]
MEGNLIIDPIYDTAIHFENGIATVSNAEGKYGCINIDGDFCNRAEI